MSTFKEYLYEGIRVKKNRHASKAGAERATRASVTVRAAVARLNRDDPEHGARTVLSRAKREATGHNKKSHYQDANKDAELADKRVKVADKRFMNARKMTGKQLRQSIKAKAKSIGLT